MLVAKFLGFYQRTGSPFYEWSERQPITSMFVWGILLTLIFGVIPVYLFNGSIYIFGVYFILFALVPYVLVYVSEMLLKHDFFN
ncbi:MAG: hypothetical protein CMM52_01775 [Rhodospirillaceae bacterium]|nr:hypothetical protein [Rhodospirillaceae bacterium]|tara:strand:+ start:5925 stop:6176 length:252 start_codon:yes stop_codon:yes gene_type:complete